MICLPLSIPEVKADFDELTNIFGSENKAYALLAQNNGYNLDLTHEGNPSKLYSDLMKLREVRENRAKAFKLKAKIYTNTFMDYYGDWLHGKAKGELDHAEPKMIAKEKAYINSSGTYVPVFTKQVPANLKKKTVLVDRVYNFLSAIGKKDVNNIIESSMKRADVKSDWKDPNRISSMLEKAKEDFEDNGIFKYDEDPYITHLNALLFENLIDKRRLIDLVNERTKSELAKKGHAVHNTITAYTKDGKHWIKTTDAEYHKTWDDASAPKRRAEIVARNRKRIDEANKTIEDVTGKKAIYIQDVMVNGVNSGIVTFDEEVMKEYNAEKYTEYLNSMQKYLETGLDTMEDINISPLKKKLKLERKQTRQEKATLEITGGKVGDINRLDNKVKNLDERILKLDKTAELVDIYNEAELNLTEIEALVKQPMITPTQHTNAMKKLEMWIKSGDFMSKDHLFLDEDMRQAKDIQDKFAVIAMRANLLFNDLYNKGKNVLANNVSDSFGKKLDFDTIVSLTHKLGLASKNVLSLNRVGHALGQYILKIVNESNDNAVREANIRAKELNEIYKNMKDSGFDEKNFYQIHNGEPTGRLIHPFSQDYFQHEKKKTTNFRRDNEIMINPLLIFGENSKEKTTHLAEIEKQLGVVLAKEYIEKARVKWEDFLHTREDHIALEYGSEELTPEQEADLKVWDIDNSPVERIKAIKNSKRLFTSDVEGKDTFLVFFPRKTDKKGNSTGFHDPNFAAIESNPAAYAFYKEAKFITNTAQKLYGYGDLTSTSLAFVEKGMLDRLSGLGTANLITKDVFNTLISSMKGGTTKYEEIDPITKKPIRKLTPSTVTIESKIDEIVEEELSKLGLTKKEAKKALTKEERDEIQRKASIEVFKRMKFDPNDTDLFKSLNLLNLSALNFKHASMIEDMVNMALTYLPKSTVNTGNDIIDTEGNTVGKSYIDNLQEMVDSTLVNTYYKEAKGDDSSLLKTVLTPAQKERKAQIEKLLDNPKLLETTRKRLEGELANLGTRVTVNSLVKNLMGFLRIKGMAWNIPAAIANLGFGKISNMYAAFEGRMYNFAEWAAAEKAVVTQWGKFNKVTENYNILGDILYEFKESNKFDTGENYFMKTVKALKPYALQTATEKSNQGTVMIAMLMHEKVTNSKGETKTLWDAIDDNGSLSEEWTLDNKSGNEIIGSLVSKIKSQIQAVHGDYTNYLMIKDTPEGRAISMFRLWFFEAYHSRFGYAKEDYIRGISTKGRYRTLWELGKAYNFNPKAVYKAYKNNELTDVDAANMRGNLAEMATMAITYALYMILKKGICGDEEKCRDANMVQLAGINMAKKIMGDVTFYINPKAWSDFIKNPTAMTGLLDDIWKLYNLSGSELFGEDEDTIYQSGYNKGNSKWNVFLHNQIPVLNSYDRLDKFSEELIQTK